MVLSRSALVAVLASVSAKVAEAAAVDACALAAALEADDACALRAECALGLVQLRSRPSPRREGADLAMPQARSELAFDDLELQAYSLESAVERFQAYSYDHPDWLSDCSSIFLDVGASVGATVRKVFEAEKYPESPLLPHLEAVFGAPSARRQPWKDSGLCAIGLEPNPRHYSRHASIEAAYEDRGWHAHIYPYAAWRGEGVMSFNATGEERAAPGDTASRGAHLSSSFAGMPGASGLAVRTVDFASFLESLLDNAAEGATVDLMVMDIEGAEYETLGQLFRENALCAGLVKRLLVETHEWGDIQHWAAGQKDARSFSEINRRLDQLRNAHSCAKGVADIQEFSDSTYAQDVDEKFGSGHRLWRESPAPTAQAESAGTSQAAMERSSRGDSPAAFESGVNPRQRHTQHQTFAGDLAHDAVGKDFAASTFSKGPTQHAARKKHAGNVRHADFAKLPTLADILTHGGKSLHGLARADTFTSGSEEHQKQEEYAGMPAGKRGEAKTAIPEALPPSAPVGSSAAAKAQHATHEPSGNVHLPTLADILSSPGEAGMPKDVGESAEALPGKASAGPPAREDWTVSAPRLGDPSAARRGSLGGRGPAPKQLDEVLAIVAHAR